MELIRDTISVCETAARGTTQAMADGDIIVPDIKPDILKILQVDADACVTDKYIENGRLVINGRVDYKVLYIPDKENVRIKSILTSMEFKQVVDAGGADADVKPIISVSVDRVEFSAVNSRKLRLRAVVGIDYELCRITETDICTDVEEESAERKKQKINFENTVDISGHDFTLKETLEVPSGQTSISEILKTDVRISDTEYKTVTGKVIVKGNAGICVLYTDEDGEIKYIEAELPFTEVFDAEGVGEDTICDIDYCLMGVMCEAQPDSDGDMRVTELDIDIEATIKGVELEEKEILSDCFIPCKNTKCDTERIRLTETVERPSVQNTLREIIDFPSNIPGVRGVYNVMTNASVSKAELQRNKIICEGKIEAYILYLTDSGENPVYSYKKDIPFSYMLECENGASMPEVNIKAVVKHVSYNLNSAGGLELRCLLDIESKLQKVTEIDNITDITAEDKETRNGIVIYFSREGDTLWEIAKRYAVPQEMIKKYNNVDEDSMGSRMKIFIPRVS
ncbi:MAG: SPOCS domain-containing protein [Candidatus Ornithomonoglobus sp.]